MSVSVDLFPGGCGTKENVPKLIDCTGWYNYMHVILLLQHYLSIIIIAKLRCVHVIVRTMISRKKTCMICTLNTDYLQGI